jgi:drug/metabolite transporter (DMT)-like permease
VWRVHGALVLVQVFFGLHYLAAKVVLTEIPPRLWALIRVGCGALVLFLLVRVAGKRLPSDGKTLAKLAFCALFGVVINQICFVEGLSRTTPIHSSIINTTIPVGTLIFAVLLGRERASTRKILSLAVAIAGVLLVIRPQASDLAEVRLVGDLLTLINAMSFSLFLVISKRLLSRVDSLAATTVLLGFGTLGMLVPGLSAGAGFEIGRVSPTTWGLGALIVVFPTALAYLLNFWSLARLDSSVVAFFIYLQPLIATSLSVLLLGEKLHGATIAGAGLIFGAVYLALASRQDRLASTPSRP